MEDVRPLTRAGSTIHVVGGALNVLATSAALMFLVKRRGVLIRRRSTVVLGFALGTYAADLASGLLHWTFDTWFDQGAGPLTRMVYIVREHHLRPARIFRYRLREEFGLLSWFGLALAAPFYALACRGRATPGRCTAAVAGITLSTQVTLMLEYHKWGHRMRRGTLPRVLQRSGLLLSPEVHLRHHSGDHDMNYCLINGAADRTLGRLGLFRALEHAVAAVTGAQPRRDDVEWARRYGRPR